MCFENMKLSSTRIKKGVIFDHHLSALNMYTQMKSLIRYVYDLLFSFSNVILRNKTNKLCDCLS